MIPRFRTDFRYLEHECAFRKALIIGEDTLMIVIHSTLLVLYSTIRVVLPRALVPRPARSLSARSTNSFRLRRATMATSILSEPMGSF
jgi:hypothetical protein